PPPAADARRRRRPWRRAAAAVPDGVGTCRHPVVTVAVVAPPRSMAPARQHRLAAGCSLHRPSLSRTCAATATATPSGPAATAVPRCNCRLGTRQLALLCCHRLRAQDRRDRRGTRPRRRRRRRRSRRRLHLGLRHCPAL
ncbi:hypothetical protein HK405_002746, partial [Cladochytrium tenue]